MRLFATSVASLRSMTVFVTDLLIPVTSIQSPVVSGNWILLSPVRFSAAIDYRYHQAATGERASTSG
jgi:hypothetical protein